MRKYYHPDREHLILLVILLILLLACASCDLGYTRREIALNRYRQENHMAVCWVAAATRYAGKGDTLMSGHCLRQAQACVRRADSLHTLIQNLEP